MTVTEASLVAAIENEPEPWLELSAYADWLEDQGRSSETPGWRWLAEAGKSPAQSEDANYACWWISFEVHGVRHGGWSPRHMLPPTWHRRLRRACHGETYWSRHYARWHDAWLDAAETYAAMTPTERAECLAWKPEA